MDRLQFLAIIIPEEASADFFAVHVNGYMPL